MRRSPEATAVVHEGGSLSYAELNRRANRLAHALIEQGVTPDERVAICLTRGAQMMVAVLAVLKAGGAYVPIDPAYPAERIAYMLEDAAPRVLITLGSLWGQRSPQLPMIDLEAGHCALQSDTDLDPRVLGLSSQHLAYVIYTSGSTGRPKGVMVEHSSLVNLLCAMKQISGLTPRDRWLAVTTLTFDIAALEIFLPLLCGATVVMADAGMSGDPARLGQALDRLEITAMQATPATWRLLVDSGWQGRAGLLALCGGEALNAELGARLSQRVGTLWNVYGPTEATVWCTAQRIEPGTRLGSTCPIGAPIANTRMYVLDAMGQPVPIGVAGELHIGGVQVARGYLNRAQLTAERFVSDPFVAQPARLYKSGDLARWRDDGTLEFLGRNDDQVKVRGFRIELGEIEATLRRQCGVDDAVVVAREESPGHTKLVAYYLAAQPLQAQQLRAELASQLPDHMLPGAWVHLSAWPLTPHGKLDRRALPAPEGADHELQVYEEPQGPIETTLARLWAELLGLQRVGRHDHFFALGGHSL
ncbi:MAG: amino acid adenylation domain-containing protein, partial [Burkholderiales bacterium]|nr:amino acid adenylation domain-containing protein [Burkholderiales bacterium]